MGFSINYCFQVEPHCLPYHLSVQLNIHTIINICVVVYTDSVANGVCRFRLTSPHQVSTDFSVAAHCTTSYCGRQDASGSMSHFGPECYSRALPTRSPPVSGVARISSRWESGPPRGPNPRGPSSERGSEVPTSLINQCIINAATEFVR